jgi:hypothetical protein
MVGEIDQLLPEVNFLSLTWQKPLGCHVSVVKSNKNTTCVILNKKYFNILKIKNLKYILKKKNKEKGLVGGGSYLLWGVGWLAGKPSGGQFPSINLIETVRLSCQRR